MKTKKVEKSFDEVFEKVSRGVDWLIYRMNRGQMDPNDLRQEVLTKIWALTQKRDLWEASKTYFLMIAKNEIMEQLQRNPRRKEIWLQDPIYTSTGGWQTCEEAYCVENNAESRMLDRMVLKQICGMLTGNARRVMELLAKGYKRGDIPEMLGIGTSAVSCIIQRKIQPLWRFAFVQ